MIRPSALAPPLAATLLLSGCMVGPTYHAPVEAPVVATHADPALVSTASQDLRWWRQFGDPELDRLMARALTGNFDLALAAARVDEARALFRESRLDQFPKVTSGAGYTFANEQVPGQADERVAIERAEVGFDARWEIDLFGRVRRQVRAARAQADASQEDLAAARVSVAAELARNYLILRGAQQQEAVVRANLETARETLRLTSTRFDLGSASAIDVEGAKVQRDTVAARLPDLATIEAQAAARIAVLCGERPGTLDDELLAAAAPPPPRESAIAAGDLGALLQRRPDVRAAERRLAAETELTGAATADLFPRIEVTGFLGFLTGDLSSLFGSSSQAWSISPGVSWPAFDMGSATARLRAQEARQGGALAQYRQTVLLAIEEFQNALVAYRNRLERLGILAARAQAADRQFELARIRYREGSIDYLRLLSAQRDKLLADEEVVTAQVAANTDVVAIYKALGGVEMPGPAGSQPGEI